LPDGTTAAVALTRPHLSDRTDRALMHDPENIVTAASIHGERSLG